MNGIRDKITRFQQKVFSVEKEYRTFKKVLNFKTFKEGMDLVNDSVKFLQGLPIQDLPDPVDGPTLGQKNSI